MSTRDSAVIGIDLGTYNSAACVLLAGETVLLRPEEGATEQGMCFPSAVEFDERGEFVHAGERARRSLPVYPQTVVWGVKRLIGRSYEAAKASGEIDRYAYRIERDAEGGCAIRVGRQTYSPRDITALILKKIKQDVEADFNPLGQSVDEVVVTVPAYFDPVQKHETEQAALAAGLQRVHLLPEPTAAASAYRLKVEQENQYVVVIDLGAGTLDVTVALLYLDDQGQLQTVEKSHGGDTTLGGLDMDDALMAYVARRWGLEKQLTDPRYRMRLRTELERGKIDLSTVEQTGLALPGKEGPAKLRLNRSELEDAVKPTVERCRTPIRIALEEAGLAPADIAHVLLVGGPTMMPIVRRCIMEEFRDNSRVVEELQSLGEKGFPVHPMEAVARGAVLGVAGKISPHGYGLRVCQQYYELMPKRQRYPSRGSLGFQYWGSERTIDFDLIRQAVDANVLREQYALLGTFQFDCVPELGVLHVDMHWEYTDNGVLHFEINQQGGASMPLYDVSRLGGHTIARPARPVPRGPDTEVIPETSTRRESWSEAELRQAERLGERLLARARQCVDAAPRLQRDNLVDLCNRLEGWLKDEAMDGNHRTPHIRDLARSILNLLYVAHLIDQTELATLRGEL